LKSTPKCLTLFSRVIAVLGCTLPAAAVLGAMSALKVSSLLPLNVPSGKPILSCNATDLLQAQIRLNGQIYDCKGSSIAVSCSTNECESETLECDVNMRQMDAYSVTCTNGTLISNSLIVCESATLAANKNVLNCFYKDAVRAPATVTHRPVTVIPLQTPAPVDEQFEENSLENRGELIDADESQLVPLVKRAMKNVFPHNLLAMPATMYLPQNPSLQPHIGRDLKQHVNGVFSANLLASSQTEKGSDNDEFDVRVNTDAPRLSATDTERIAGNWRDQAQSRWEVDPSIKTTPGGGGGGTKTKTVSRSEFGAPQHDMHDRHIFT
jgi:hypothetical protein